MTEIMRFRWCCVFYLKWSHDQGGC